MNVVLLLWSGVDRFRREARASEGGGLGGPGQSKSDVALVRTHANTPPPHFVLILRKKVRPDHTCLRWMAKQVRTARSEHMRVGSASEMPLAVFPSFSVSKLVHL